MKTCITHGTSELGMDLFLRDGFLKPSIRIGNLPTSLDGSFCNVAYTPFILQINKNAIHEFNGKPCFYLPGCSEVYFDDYGLFNARYLWEWEIFFTESIPMDYVDAIYVVTIGGHVTNAMKMLTSWFERDYGTAKLLVYDFGERYKFWGDALGYRCYRHVKKILEIYGVDFGDLTKPEHMDVLEDVMYYIDKANRHMAEYTDTVELYDRLYEEFEKKYLKDDVHNNNIMFPRLRKLLKR